MSSVYKSRTKINLYLIQIDALSWIMLESDLGLFLVHLALGLQGSQCHVPVVDGVVVRPEWTLVLQVFHALSGKVVVAHDWLAAEVAHEGTTVAARDFVAAILKFE